MMTLNEILPALRAHWLGLVLIWAAVVALILGLSLAAPPRYEATAAVAVEMSGMDPVLGHEITRPNASPYVYIASQAEVLKSEEVARGAVRDLGLDKDPAWMERWKQSTKGQGDYEAWLAGLLLRKLDVRPGRDTNVLAISYISPDPEFSAAVANAFVKSYIDTSLEMRVGPARQVNAFFSERAKPLREALEQARARLTAYEKEHGVSVGDTLDVETARLNELSTQLVTLQDQAAEVANMRRQARANPADLREVRNDPEVAALTSELVRQQGHLAELKSEFGDQHQAVIQARQSVNDARRRLSGAMRRIADSLAAPARVIEGRLAEVKGAIARQRAVVQQRKAQRDAAAALVRDVDNAQKAYDAVLARASQTALESKNTVQATISVLKKASPPLWSPAFLMRNGLVAFVLGLLLGIAYALIAEKRDRRLRTVADVTVRLGQPLILALPDGQRLRDRRGEETRRRLVPMPLLPAPK